MVKEMSVESMGSGLHKLSIDLVPVFEERRRGYIRGWGGRTGEKGLIRREVFLGDTGESDTGCRKWYRTGRSGEGDEWSTTRVRPHNPQTTRHSVRRVRRKE